MWFVLLTFLVICLAEEQEHTCPYFSSCAINRGACNEIACGGTTWYPQKAAICCPIGKMALCKCATGSVATCECL